MANANPFALLDEDGETKRAEVQKEAVPEKESKGKENTKATKKPAATGADDVLGPAKKDSKNQRGPMKSGFTRKRDFDRSAKGKGEKRGGAGKANWGAPGDEIKEELEKNEEAGEEGTPEEEEIKEITLEDYEKLLQEKKAAINAAAGKPTEADLSAFEGLSVFEKKEEEENNPLSLTGAKGIKGKQRAKALKEKETLIPNFKIEDKSYAPRERRQPGAGRTGGRGAGRGNGRAGRGGERPNRRPRDSVPSPLNDVAAFPTLGA